MYLIRSKSIHDIKWNLPTTKVPLRNKGLGGTNSSSVSNVPSTYICLILFALLINRHTWTHSSWLTTVGPEKKDEKAAKPIKYGLISAKKKIFLV